MFTLGGTTPHERHSVGGKVQCTAFNVGNVEGHEKKARGMRNQHCILMHKNILSNHDDFRNDKIILEKYLTEGGIKWL